MKVISCTGNFKGDMLQTITIPDSAIIRSGRPMFLPRWADEFIARPAIAYHCCRLGKTISPRFAYRYCDAVAPAVVVSAAGLETPQKFPLSSALATAFDGAFLLGDWMSINENGLREDHTITMNITGNEPLKLCTGEFFSPFDGLLATLSRYFTIKMGDIISCASNKTVRLRIGTTVETEIDGDRQLIIRIK